MSRFFGGGAGAFGGRHLGGAFGGGGGPTANIGNPVLLGTKFEGASSQTIVLTGVDVAATDAVFVGAAINSSTRTITGVTDSAGNTYVKRLDNQHAVSTTLHHYLWVCENPSPIVAGSITATADVATVSEKGIIAMKCSGIDPAAAFDQVAAPVDGAAASAVWAVGPTSALSQADELAVAIVMTGAAAAFPTTDPPFTEIGDLSLNVRRMAMSWAKTTAAAAVSASGTINSTSSYVADLATFRGELT